MITIATKIYILSKVLEVQESEIDEEFIQEELNMDWDEFDSLDNEDFYYELVSVYDDDREDFISIVFGYNDTEFIDYIGGFQELEECDKEVFVETIQDFLIKLFTYDEGGIEPISNKEYLSRKIKSISKRKIVYPLRSGLIKLLTPLIKKHYEIEKIPFCLEIHPIKEWSRELAVEWIIENDISLDELEEI